MHKIFCIGFHKTGTTSLHSLLETLGYKVKGCYKVRDRKFVDNLKRDKFDEIKKVADQYDAFRDNPWAILYKELDKFYPSSKFILTIRDKESWIKSIVNHCGIITTPMRKFIYGFGNPIQHQRKYLDRYERHNKEVVDYFKEKRQDLLVIDISEKDAVKRICEFLNRKAPYETMPHKHKGNYSRPIFESLKKIIRRFIPSG